MAIGNATYPDITVVNPTFTRVTLHMIDASGDLYTESVKSVIALTDAEIKAWADAYQTATQASVYQISVEQVYEGDADTNNAGTLQRNSTRNGINLLFRDVDALKTFTGRLVAPEPDTMQGNQDIPLLGDPIMANLITSYLTVLASYNHDSGQYTERRERKNNPRVKS